MASEVRWGLSPVRRIQDGRTDGVGIARHQRHRDGRAVGHAEHVPLLHPECLPDRLKKLLGAAEVYPVAFF